MFTRGYWAIAFISAIFPILLAVGVLGSPSPKAPPAVLAVSAEVQEAAGGADKISADQALAIVAQSAIETVSWAEANWTPASGEEVYRVMFGGALFESYAKHPDSVQTVQTGAGEISSAAAGRFQFMPDTWEWLYEQYDYWPVGPNGEEFFPLAQDIGFIRLFARTGAFYQLEKGTTVLNQVVSVDPEAIAKSMNAAAATWCALPSYTPAARGACNDPRQSQKGMAETIAVFNEAMRRNQNLSGSEALAKPPFVSLEGAGTLVGITGDTGTSTGPHLDIRYGRSFDPARNRPTEEHLNRILAEGKPITSFPLTSEHRSRNKNRPTHDGVDYGTPVGLRLTVSQPIQSVSKPAWDTYGGGWYTSVTFTDGVVLNLLHLDDSVQGAGIGSD